MNERIRKLAEQAAKWAQQAQWSTDSRFGDRPFSDLYDEKFAELIVKKFAELLVRECCDIFVELRTRPADLAVKDVKKHFGVE